MNAVMYSSQRDDWETPKWLFDQLDAQYHFELDVCAQSHDTKCKRFFSPEQDGLSHPWYGACWMNPPYGREIVKWVQKAYYAATYGGATVVCLLPARTDTNWWHEYVLGGASQITYLRGRLRFVGAKNSAPFPSAVVVFAPPGKAEAEAAR